MCITIKLDFNHSGFEQACTNGKFIKLMLAKAKPN